jgi:serine/threonine protein kinase
MQLKTESKGESVTLDTNRVLGSGGEAKVFAVLQKPDLVAKIYHKPTSQRAHKLKIMHANPPGDPMANLGHISIAWPVDLLRSDHANPRVVGFLMPNISAMGSILNFYNPQMRRQKCPLFNYKYLHRTARNLATAVRALHNRGYVIGDINESNILVSDSSLVTLVDTDSFQVPDPSTGNTHRCPVGKPEYTPPELQGVSFSEVDRQPQHDRFGLSVLIFQLLMEGFHPFTGRFHGEGDPPPIEDRIAGGHFPYRKRWYRPYAPSPLSPDINILHPHLKSLFMRCFESGHKRPSRRPDAQTWIDALTASEDALVECRQNKQHLYGNHLQHCPWCYRTTRLGGRDPFPSSQALYKGLPIATAPPKHKPIAPLTPQKAHQSLSSSSSAIITGQPKKAKKWVLGIPLFLLGAWLFTQFELPFPNLDLPPLGTIPKTASRPPAPEERQAEETPTADIQANLPIDPFLNLLNRFQGLDNPNRSDQERLRLYPQFLEDFSTHPDSEEYLEYVKGRWEELSFAQITDAYQKFNTDATETTAAALLEASKAYLQTQSKRQSSTTHAQRFARWHLDTTQAHPLRLIIGQGQKFYVRIILNGNVYVETKQLNGFASVALPNYKSTDHLVIKGYQDDRFDDTLFEQTLTVNSFKGNHHLSLVNKRGTIHVQVIFEDYPAKPPL